MTDNQTKDVVVVLSAGRSGTSLLMNVMNRLGMELSEEMIPGRYGNPDGYFEDSEIVQIHQNLIKDISAKANLPLPDNWLLNEKVKSAVPKLKTILKDRLQKCNGTWGFKDPRTSVLLPLWLRVFNSAVVNPIFVLAIRHPAAMVVSMRRIVDNDDTVTELQWLHRTCEALYNTSGDCYIVHYEDWFRRGEEIAGELLNYTGLENSFGEKDISDALRGLIKDNLNRSVYEDYDIQNKYVAMLYESLQNCRGKDFDRSKLMETVKECRNAIHGFKGWYQLALEAGSDKNQENVNKIKKLENELKDKEEKQSARIEELEIDVAKSVSNCNSYLHKIKDLEDEVCHLRIRVTALALASTNNASESGRQSKGIVSGLDYELNRCRCELRAMRSSVTYRTGYFVVKAFSKPGKNTILLPYRLIRIFLKHLATRKRKVIT